MEEAINVKPSPVEMGALLGEKPRPYPGLAPVAKRLHDMMADLAKLEKSAYELDQIRATLLLNFGSTDKNHYGFRVADSGSTIDILMSVLTQLWTTKIGATGE